MKNASLKYLIRCWIKFPYSPQEIIKHKNIFHHYKTSNGIHERLKIITIEIGLYMCAY